MHFPFCKHRCAYCSFVSSTDFSLQEEYYYRLKAEISSRVPYGESDTLYFGGGTPSAVKHGLLSEVYREIEKYFGSRYAEFTVEANPDSVSAEFLSECRDMGVNRISMGLQSADDSVLKKIGRIHDVAKFLAAARTIKAYGFENVSSDLILGLPGQTLSDVENAVRLFDKTGMTHVSVYSLSVESGTPLYESGYKPDDDRQADMYGRAVEILKQYGYLRYEVSNFARDGKIALHNYKYWTGADYYGFGAAAHSLEKNVRRENTDSLYDYLAGKTLKAEYKLTPTDVRTEYIMLRLRTEKGINLLDYGLRFGVPLLAEKEKEIKKLLSAKVIEINGNILKTTDKGFYLLNSVITELL